MSTDTSKLKHRRVARALADEIESGSLKPGDRLAPEMDLAQRFDVSYMTMRQAIRNLVDENALVRVKGKGTFVAHRHSAEEAALASPMALLIPIELLQDDPHYLPDVLKGFQEYMGDRNQSVSFHSNTDAERSALDPRTAVACLLFERPSLESIEQLRDRGHRVLAINRYTGRRLIPSVRIDDTCGVEKAVEYLASLGHERIGFVKGPPENLDANDRLRGFRAGVDRFGIKRAPEAGDGFTAASGYAAARILLSGASRPTAIVCASDDSAMGVIKAAQDAGLSVPRGLSIVGYGAFALAQFTTPSLTTVRQPRVELGRAAAASLIQVAAGETPEDIVIPTDLLIRESAVAAQSSVTAAL